DVVVQPFQPQEGLRDYYWAGDVLLLPSTGEGFPLVVMEAMVCGTPAIVSTETYAAWNQGREYFLVCESTADAVGEVLASRSRLLDPDARQQISAYARAQWDWDQVARDSVALLSEMRLT